MHRMMTYLAMAAALMVMAGASSARAAVGCTLRDPDRDIRRIFPKATGYKTEFITIQERGGAGLATEVEKKLGDKLDDKYETLDVPYAYYTVLKGQEPIGRVHGVNQKGKFGAMQLILATDLSGTVVAFYYQKIRSPESKRFRKKAFTDLFEGLTLADFMPRLSERAAAIADPSKKSADDFRATLRGLTKNLILLDIFFLDRKHDKAASDDK